MWTWIIWRSGEWYAEAGVDLRQWTVGFNAYPASVLGHHAVNVFLGPVRLGVWRDLVIPAHKRDGGAHERR